MNRLLVIFLFALSFNVFADDNISTLRLLQNKMLTQSKAIKYKFDKQAIINSGVYENIYVDEFNIIDYLDIMEKSFELFTSVNNTDNLSKGRIEIIAQKIGRLCDTSAIKLLKYLDEVKIDEIKFELVSQTNNAKEACNTIKYFSKK